MNCKKSIKNRNNMEKKITQFLRYVNSCKNLCFVLLCVIISYSNNTLCYFILFFQKIKIGNFLQKIRIIEKITQFNIIFYLKWRKIMFKLVSNYKPTGDQPRAIEYLSNGIKKGKKFQTLLGVTGSRKNFYYG